MHRQFSSASAGILRRELETYGVTCLRQAIDPAQLVSLLEDIESCLADNKQLLLDYGSNRKVINGFFLWTRNDNLRAFLCESSLPRIAAVLMNSSKINLFCDHLFIKGPHTERHATPWHSDQPHWVIDGRMVVTFWIALDYVTKDSGAVQFIQGSHLWDYTRDGFYRIAGEEYEAIEDIDSKCEKFDIIHYDLAPGDMTVHHGMTMHCAFGNRTASHLRRGYAVRYTGDDVVYRPNPSFQTPAPIELQPGQVLDSPLFPVVFPNRHLRFGHGASTEF
jgi:ectoine hydroxylase-related dioxygenase (phytanoyl-CoA dioxygenase family)